MQKNLCFSGAIWYHWVMRNAKEQTTSNEEMVTISRAEYENMQAQIQWLMEQLSIVPAKAVWSVLGTDLGGCHGAAESVV